MGFQKKAHHVAALHPDIAVIPECGRSSLAALEEYEYTGAWVGSNEHKGLGVFVRKPWRLRPLCRPKQRWIAAVDVEGRVSPLRVIAVWACKVGEFKANNYIGQVYEAFLGNPDWFACPRTIVAGDFNSNSSWDYARPIGNHTAVVEILQKHGIVSAYHEFFEEEQGKETRKTLDFRKDRQNRFHIDYVFIPKAWRARLRKVSIGNHKWTALSDHRPMIVDV
jgi:endonuclease/exonuclease/phosphatase family metal-dependent hydrolase